MARSPLDDVLELGVRGLGAIGKVGLAYAARHRPVSFVQQNHGHVSRKPEWQPVYPLHHAAAGASVV
jgi:hypothetical protein